VILDKAITLLGEDDLRTQNEGELLLFATAETFSFYGDLFAKTNVPDVFSTFHLEFVIIMILSPKLINLIFLRTKCLYKLDAGNSLKKVCVDVSHFLLRPFRYFMQPSSDTGHGKTDKREHKKNEKGCLGVNRESNRYEHNNYECLSEEVCQTIRNSILNNINIMGNAGNQFSRTLLAEIIQR